MAGHVDERPHPRGVLRWLLRRPIWLYRLNVGWLLGRSHVLLRHRGRSTGAVRETVLEVVTLDPSTDERIVASYWGTGSDWWQNVEAGGALEIIASRERFVPSVRALDLPERIEALHTYRRDRPVWSWIGARTFQLPTGTDASALRRTAQRLPMVAFSPGGDRS